MAHTSCRFWIKFFIWLGMSGGLYPIINIYFNNILISIVISLIINSPIMITDRIYFYIIKKYKKNKKLEEKLLEEEKMKSTGEWYITVDCPECGEKTLKRKGFCNNCGKDLRSL